MAAPKMETRVRREQILQAALEIIGTEGVSGLSVANVARRVGLVPSALYRHFQSKDEIIEGLLEMVRANLLGFVARARTESPDAVECLRRLLVRHLRFLEKHSAIPRLVFSEEVAAENPDHRTRVYGIVQSYLAEVEAVIREGQGGEQIRRDLDAPALARLFLGLVQPAVILWRMSGGDFDLERHGDEVWALYHALLVSPTGP